MLDFVEKVEDQGARGICFTVDNMYVSHRERSIHNGFVRRWCDSGIPRDADGNLIYKDGEVTWTTGRFPQMRFPAPTWESVKKLRDMTDLKILLKTVPAVVFAREASARALREPDIVRLRRSAARLGTPEARAEFDAAFQEALLAKQAELAAEFDAIHTVERARDVGSVEEIVAPNDLRRFLIARLDQLD